MNLYEERRWRRSRKVADNRRKDVFQQKTLRRHKIKAGNEADIFDPFLSIANIFFVMLRKAGEKRF